jgi:polysaccharide transporter, PST family
MLPFFLQKQLKGRIKLKQIIRNAGWLFAERVLRLFGELFVGVWLARYLEPEQFGIYSYAIAFVALFIPLSTLGLDYVVVRELVRHPEQKDEILDTTFALKLFGGIVGFVITTITIFLVRPEDNVTHYLVIVIALGVIFKAFETIDLWFQSQVNSKATAISKSLALSIATIIKFLLIKFQAPLFCFAWTILIENFIFATGSIVAYIYHKKLLGFTNFNWLQCKKLVNDSLPLMLSGIAVTIYMKIDQIMLGQMTSATEVGIYSAAVQLSEAWYFLPMIITNSVFPAIVEYRKTNEKLYYDKLQEIFRLMVGLTYIVAIPCTFFDNWIVDWVFGEKYYAVGAILSWHIWSGLFVSLGVARNLWITTENISHLSLITTLIGALVNIQLNFLLIPSFQALGAAMATLIAYSIAALFSGFLFRETRTISYLMFKAIIFF